VDVHNYSCSDIEGHRSHLRSLLSSPATNVANLSVQKLDKELTELEEKLLDSRAAEARTRSAATELEHSVSVLTAELAESQKLHNHAIALVKEYEGGVANRCGPSVFAVCRSI
jgi:uncharacterized membrane protein YheB (UPF0754 family)